MNKLPESCVVNQIISKDRFDKHKDEFRDKIERIRYMYQIDKNTTNYNQYDDNESIVVIQLTLKEDTDITKIVKTIDNAIPFNIVYEIQYDNQVKYGFYDQQLFTTEYQSNISLDLLSNDVNELYEKMKKQILGVTQTKLSSEGLVQINIEIKQLQVQLTRLEVERRKEKQLNKRLEIKEKMKKLNKRLEELYEVL
ncbi:MAG: DUF4391 domain-containing protein [Coprobacillaceae bacterium]